MGGQEWMLIAVIVALLFGAKRLPELGRNLGSGMREFKKSITGDGDESHAELTDDREKTTANAGASEKEKSESSTQSSTQSSTH